MRCIWGSCLSWSCRRASWPHVHLNRFDARHLLVQAVAHQLRQCVRQSFKGRLNFLEQGPFTLGKGGPELVEQAAQGVGGCMMRIFMSSSRWRCKVSVACCAAVLVPTNFTPGCCTANQIARASVASALLPLTKGRTIFACNSRTVCPSFLSSRAQWCAPPQASMATRQGARLAKCSSALVRLICTLMISPVPMFTVCIWKHVFGDVQTEHLLAVHGADDLSGVHSCITIHGGYSVVE